MSVTAGTGEFAGGIYASPEEIIRDGNNLISKAAELQVELSKFDSEINNLMGVWMGPAALALKNVYEDFKPVLEKFRDTLDSKGKALVGAGNIHSDTEEQNANDARRVDTSI